MVGQQIRFVYLNVDSYLYENISEDCSEDEDADESNSLEFFKLIEQDKCLLDNTFLLTAISARFKSYSNRTDSISIKSVVGAIDAPPPEQA